MDYKEGFYKLDNGEILYATNFVYNKDYTLEITKKDDITYPVDGWYYFSNVEDACSQFKIPVPKQKE